MIRTNAICEWKNRPIMKARMERLAKQRRKELSMQRRSLMSRFVRKSLLGVNVRGGGVVLLGDKDCYSIVFL